MTSPIAHRLDELAQWRLELGQHVHQLARTLAEQELLDDAELALAAGLRERLASEKLVLAFVAEFSRGKSELINAIFFADAGGRVLPATPGRTTMCPVELRFEPELAPRLALLPIETRLRGLSLGELRGRDEHWEVLPLDPGNPASLVQALSAVTRVQQVSLEQAVALGFWDESQPDDNPPRGADGRVEVPAWRHAVINYPHPLLRQGLVVVDTPGLNAIGAEPELTLGLLPSAHAVVFVLAADTGVTKSDLTIWREHLGQASLDRFVVLNKIDTLQDPLASVAQVQQQIERQRLETARTLAVPSSRVFALSARDALAARLVDDAPGLAASRLPPLEAALAGQLLPRRQQLLVDSAVAVVDKLRGSALRRLGQRRRQQAEQLLELRGLRGKSGAKLRMMVERVDGEVADFERCTAKLAALRSVQARILRDLLAPLSSDTLRAEVSAMQQAMSARTLRFGTKAVFDTLMQRLRQSLSQAAVQAQEMRQMLEAGFRDLNTEFGFAFELAPVPDLEPFKAELDLIDQNYGRYLGLGQVWRMATPGFAEQFRRMLVSKLRVVFETAAGELELWSKSATGQVELQLRERRRTFTRRRDALQRVQGAAGELEQRISEVQAQDQHLLALQQRLDALAADVLATARGRSRAGQDIKARARAAAEAAAVRAGGAAAGDAAAAPGPAAPPAVLTLSSGIAQGTGHRVTTHTVPLAAGFAPARPEPPAADFAIDIRAAITAAPPALALPSRGAEPVRSPQARPQNPAQLLAPPASADAVATSPAAAAPAAAAPAVAPASGPASARPWHASLAAGSDTPPGVSPRVQAFSQAVFAAIAPQHPEGRLGSPAASVPVTIKPDSAIVELPGESGFARAAAHISEVIERIQLDLGPDPAPAPSPTDLAASLGIDDLPKPKPQQDAA